MSLVRGKRLRRAILALLGGLALGLLAVGCIPSTFNYPIDHFNEMHYQQYFRRQEPPNVTVPGGAVPSTGAEPTLAPAAYASLNNPVQRPPADLERAASLYRTNCQVCHGPQGRGDGLVGAILQGYPGVPLPQDYNNPAAAQQTDGQLFGTLTLGKRDENTLQGMPAFGNLLTAEERWLLVHQVRVFQGR